MDVHDHSAKTADARGETLDLFKDIVSDGQVEVWLKCAEPQQYFGAAQADMYLRAGDAPFEWNFVKGYFGIWLQTLLVITLGVMFSTFLSGPVAHDRHGRGRCWAGSSATSCTASPLQQTYGGGPFESLSRIVTQENITARLEPGVQTTVVRCSIRWPTSACGCCR